MRIARWNKTFFQIISTISNRNFQIDHFLIEPNHNLILLFDIKQNEHRETITYVYQYNHIIREIGSEDDFIVERTQIISSSYDLTASNIYLFSEYKTNNNTYVLFCDQNALQITTEERCEYFELKNDVSENKAIFRKVDRIQLDNMTFSEDVKIKFERIHTTEIFFIQSSVRFVFF